MPRKKVIYSNLSDDIRRLLDELEASGVPGEAALKKRLKSWYDKLDTQEASVADHMFQLQERMKELDCLYSVISCLQTPRPDLNIDEVMQKAITAIPAGFWQPDRTSVALRIGTRTYKTPNYSLSANQIVSTLKLRDGVDLELGVCLRTDDNDSGFLKEEQALLDKTASLLRKFYDHYLSVLELAEREELFRTTLYSIGDAVITTDREGRIQHINTIAEELTGWKKEEAVHTSVEKVFRIINEKSREKVESPVEKVLQCGRIVALANHTLLIAKDGREIPIADSGAPIRTKKGEVIGVVLVFRDQLEERIFQQKLLQSEEKFRSIVEQAPEPIFIQVDARFAYVNPAAMRLYGAWYPDELLGTPVMDRFHSDYHDVIRKRIKRLNEKRESLTEVSEQVHLRVDGSQIWVETTGTPIEYEGKQGGLVFVRNITGRKKAEEQLYESESRYRSLFENNHTVMLIIDPERGEVVDVNPAASEFYGWTRSKMQGMKLSKFIMLSQENIIAELGQAVMDKKVYNRHQHQQKNKAVRNVEMYSGTIAIRGRNLIYSIVFDVTDRLHYEQVVQENLKEKEVLLAEIHHRVKNNMAVISGLLELEAESTSYPGLDEILSNTNNRIRSMALIHEKLYQAESFSEIEFGTYMKELAGHIRDNFGKQHDIAIEFDVDSIQLDITKAVPCGIILNELLTNGMKYAFNENNGKGSIHLGLKASKNEILLSYLDNGKGFNESTLKDYRSGHLKTLGLQLIYGLSKQLQGTAKFDNQNGAYVEIRFTQ